MNASAGYGGLQQPAGGYADAGAGGVAPANYNASQTPKSSYAKPDAGASPTGLANGVNLQPSYCFGGDVDLGWDVMDGSFSRIKSVRIEIEAGQEVNAARWIREATSKRTVIATYHDKDMLDDPKRLKDPGELLKAAAWWATYYPTLSKSGNFTINLLNEWGGKKNPADDFAAAYNEAIKKVRGVYSGPIVVDMPGFGQEVHTGVLALAKFTDRNIVPSMHVYPNAWDDARNVAVTTADVDELKATGLDCIVGEFGDNGKAEATKWKDVVNYAKSKGWPVFAWAWSGDGGIMNMIEPKTFLAYTPGPVAPPLSRYNITSYANKVYAFL